MIQMLGDYPDPIGWELCPVSRYLYTTVLQGDLKMNALEQANAYWHSSQAGEFVFFLAIT